MNIVVIGGGPGGYTAAIEAAHSGLSVTLVERGEIGGTCLNVGCIPTKSLLQSARIWSQAARRGWLLAGELSRAEWSKVQSQKDGVVRKLTDGVSNLLKSAGVNVIHGYVRFVGPNEVEIQGTEDTQRLCFDKAIIATGSKVSIPPIPGSGETGVYTSDELLSIKSIPERLVIVGGGVIGIEFASLFRQLKSEVVVVEFADEILLRHDRRTVSHLKTLLKQQGIGFQTKSTVKGITRTASGLQVEVERADHSTTKFVADAVLLAAGRSGNIDNLGLQNTNVEVNHDKLVVDDHCRTSQDGVYAIGDCSTDMMLAHVAMAHARAAVADILGRPHEPLNRFLVPQCIYCQPELASVGMTEEDAQSLATDFAVAEFPMGANGRSLIEGEGGICRIIYETQSVVVLGVHIVGPNATELIQQASLGLQLEFTLRELANVIHAHPTVSEVMHEAAMVGLGTPIHVPMKREVFH